MSELLENKEIDCLVCGKKTKVRFNINLKAKPICNYCAKLITLQQIKWYVEHDDAKP